MRSRILLGVSAWLLGAASATAGSLYAVDQLGEGLLAQHGKEISVATVNAELALENSGRTGPPAPIATPSPSPSTPRKQQPTARAHQTRPTRHVPRQSTKLLTSSGGTTAASCENGLALLVYWSPAQGFEADDVSKGPARVATVTFTSDADGVMMRVTCTSAGVPVAHVSPLNWGGSHHNE